MSENLVKLKYVLYFTNTSKLLNLSWFDWRTDNDVMMTSPLESLKFYLEVSVSISIIFMIVTFERGTSIVHVQFKLSA